MAKKQIETMPGKDSSEIAANSISFLLDGSLRRICFDGTTSYSPTTTLLEYLRSLPDHRGAKEGCAEGDCGACTIVIADHDGNGTLRYRAIDSCLVFLPMIHGKQIITVENLTGSNGKLHPVQEALAESFGTQCGFCTPGIVMSMFALYKNINHPSRDEIDNALTGNLCRCTGYQSIVEAAENACNHRENDHFSRNERQLADLLSSIPARSLVLKTQQQQYFQPVTKAEALTLLHDRPQATVIGGATDVALRVSKSHEIIDTIIDLSAIKELRDYADESDRLILGSGLSLNEIIPIVQGLFPALYTMLRVFGSDQIRNIGTLGGNIGTASPIGDTLPILLAYRALLMLEDTRGSRVIPLEKYILGYRKTARRYDELITQIILPKPQKNVRIESYKISKRKNMDISTVSAGFRLELELDNTVKSIILAYGGMADHVKRAQSAETYLNGKEWTRSTVEQAMQLISNDFHPIDDARGSALFRMTAARNLLIKFFNDQ